MRWVDAFSRWLPALALAATVGCSTGNSVVGGPADAGVDVATDMGPPACPTGQSRCGGQCVDTASDRANCGGCANACGQAQVCSSGVCTLSCPTGQNACGGVCAPTAAPAAPRAPRARCAPRAPARSPAARAPPTARASAATLRPTTPTAARAAGPAPRARCAPRRVRGVLRRGLTNCSGVCRDLRPTGQLRRLRQRCAAGQVCSAGACQSPAARAPPTAAGVCRDLRPTTPTAAPAAPPCPSGQVCSAGRAWCPAARAPPTARASAATSTDRATAAPAARACASGQVCSAGACTVSCGGHHQLLGRLPRPQTDNAQLRRLRPRLRLGPGVLARLVRVSCGAGLTNCDGRLPRPRPRTTTTAAPAAAPAPRARCAPRRVRGVLRRRAHPTARASAATSRRQRQLRRLRRACAGARSARAGRAR
jgi:hypothetical protein